MVSQSLELLFSWCEEHFTNLKNLLWNARVPMDVQCTLWNHMPIKNPSFVKSVTGNRTGLSSSSVYLIWNLLCFIHITIFTIFIFFPKYSPLHLFSIHCYIKRQSVVAAPDCQCCKATINRRRPAGNSC